jgi:hypothetical protein
MNEQKKIKAILQVIKDTISGYSADDEWLVLDVYNAVFGCAYESIDDIPSIDILLESI